MYPHFVPSSSLLVSIHQKARGVQPRPRKRSQWHSPHSNRGYGRRTNTRRDPVVHLVWSLIRVLGFVPFKLWAKGVKFPHDAGTRLAGTFCTPHPVPKK